MGGWNTFDASLDTNPYFGRSFHPCLKEAIVISAILVYFALVTLRIISTNSTCHSTFYLFGPTFCNLFPDTLNLSLHCYGETIRKEKILRLVCILCLSHPQSCSSALLLALSRSKHGRFHQHLCPYQLHWQNRCWYSCFSRSIWIQPNCLSTVIISYCWVPWSKARRVDESVWVLLWIFWNGKYTFQVEKMHELADILTQECSLIDINVQLATPPS